MPVPYLAIDMPELTASTNNGPDLQPATWTTRFTVSVASLCFLVHLFFKRSIRSIDKTRQGRHARSDVLALALASKHRTRFRPQHVHQIRSDGTSSAQCAVIEPCLPVLPSHSTPSPSHLLTILMNTG